MRQYKYNKKAGALQEAAVSSMGSTSVTQLLSEDSFESDDSGLYDLQQVTVEESLPMRQEATSPAALQPHMIGVQSMGSPRGRRGPRQPPSPGAAGDVASGATSSVDPSSYTTGRWTMFFYVIDEGQRMMMTNSDGSIEIIEGPAKVFRWWRRFRTMEHHVAHPGEFLIVRFRDGSQEHIAGPAHEWLDSRVHLAITKEDSIQIGEKEAIVVYCKEDDGKVTRRIVHGPEDFVPGPGEWLHTFSWHGSAGGSDGYRKVPNGLVFEKLWLLPDQMYHDIPDVRTADGVVITIRLMIFFELVDVETMLTTTHDPIGDFVNAATSDVVEHIGKLDFEGFKSSTEKLNDLATYKQLVTRGESCGYRINKVVYRGYGAPEALQKMHEKAMESRTRLQLEKATEEQAQKLADFQLERRIEREAQEVEAKARKQKQELELQMKWEQSSIERSREKGDFRRQQELLDQKQLQGLDQLRNQRLTEHLQGLRDLNVDLTRYLTQNRADRIIELRGNDDASTHIHLQPSELDGEEP